MHEQAAQPEAPEVGELRRRLMAAQAEAAEARRELAAAEQRGLWALTLFAAVSRVYEGRSLRELYRALDDIAAALLGGRPLALYADASGGARLRRLHGDGAAATLLLGEGVVGRAAAESRTVAGWEPGLAAEVVAAPLATEPGLLGAVVMLERGTRAPLDADHLQLLEIVARHAGYVLEVLLPRGSS